MASKKKTTTVNKEPVFSWVTQSSKPRGGQILQYETRLEEDGLIRCNCPGWIFNKNSPEAKTCRHKKRYEAEAPDILKMFKNGEELPLYNPGGSVTTLDTSPAAAHKAPKDSKIKFGRKIILDD